MIFIRMFLVLPILLVILLIAVVLMGTAWVCWFIDSICYICLMCLSIAARSLDRLVRSPPDVTVKRRITILRGKDDPPSEDL